MVPRAENKFQAQRFVPPCAWRSPSQLLDEIKSQIQTARSGALASVLAEARNYRVTLWTRLTRFLE